MSSFSALLRTICFTAIVFGLAASCSSKWSPQDSGSSERGEHASYHVWEVYGGDHGSSQYSALGQINRDNVDQLEVAWTHHTGDADKGDGSQIQTSPIVVDSVLYAVSAGLKAIALNAATGERFWTFDPWTEELDPEDQGVNRGVATWSDGEERRIFHSAAHRLYALDADTGRPIREFGEGGWVDLRAGLGRDPAELWGTATTPGVVYEDLLIQGTRVSESAGAAPGDIRAYDVRTGEVRWAFHTIPKPGEFGHETWPENARERFGAANSWAGLALDAERGIVYAPTGSAAFDYYGGDRPGKNLFANSVLALDAETGERIWHFQTVHHDIFDRDLPAPPNLVTVECEGRLVDAIAQVTKTGLVFLFDRETGKPLFPVEERPVPASTLKGEAAWPTQPFPTKPPPFMRQSFTEDLITQRTPEAHAAVRAEFEDLRTGGVFNPPSEEGSIFFPGLDGGAEWGGAAIDPERGILYVNANEMPWIVAMSEVEDMQPEGPASGREVYLTYCAACHGSDLQGDNDRYPSLVDLADRSTATEVKQVLERGRGFMPSFTMLSEEEKEAVAAFLLKLEADEVDLADRRTSDESVPESPYQVSRFTRFFDPDGYPAITPPWGTLNAIDLNRGEILWQVPVGEFDELTARGLSQTGTENYGGPIATAGGLLFIGATQDERFRAFDKETGEVLWTTDLPYGGYATPITYEIDGRQYVVIAAGGGKMGTPSGDAYIAFALPE